MNGTPAFGNRLGTKINMNYRASSVRNATLTALALGLTLSACAPANQEAAPSASPFTSVTATETVTSTATAAPTAAATPTPSPTAVGGPTVAPVVPVAPAPEPVAPKLATFTFPDGHISFAHPANWTIKTQQGPYLDYVNETDKAKSVEAHIYDEKGNKVSVIASGGYGGGAAGPSLLTVLDTQQVPNFPARDGDTVFAFIKYENPVDHSVFYRMGNMSAEFVTNGEGTSGSYVRIVENGASEAYVEFDSPAFNSLESAKAWMKTEQYSQLKAMLTSMRYV
ncbi:hypothetical protein J2W14_000746 [Pseudarthrobacter oxydans]|uniref:hypothetical protein n=1 Tax=Pseudarthrobacter oxydans TaxID=1671 RepID=UPI0027838E83|nr:hypothetical protein [Pseudarthrobacter oxydans]MDP9981366.1 hypothetical protein [Pseudarthrobacter oxydans]